MNKIQSPDYIDDPLSHYLVASAIHGVEISHEANHELQYIPPHCTLMHWFSVPSFSACNVLSEIGDTISRLSAPEIVIDGTDFFGPNKTMPVYLIRKTTYLQKIHTSIFELVKSSEGLFKHVQFCGNSYNPHMSIHPGIAENLAVGVTLVTNSAFVVQSDTIGPESNIRLVSEINYHSD